MPSSELLSCGLQSCSKNITKTQGSISCILCCKWFHAACVGVNAEQLAVLAKGKGTLGHVCDSCKAVRVEPDVGTFREDLRIGLLDIQTKFDAILSEVKQELNSKFTELRKDIDSCNKLIEFIDNSTAKKIKFLEEQNEVLLKRNNRNDILINGLPKYQENIYDIVMKIFKELEVNIELNDIINCHFINNGNTVLVKVNNVRKRDLAMMNYFKSRRLSLSSFVTTDINKRIYLNDHHTPKVGRLLFECRKLRKQQKILKFRLINADKPKIKVTLTNNDIKIMDLTEFYSFFNINNA